ncbi:Chromatin modification-related protein [Mycena indigotica]|uniref:Chromatin modification-related protein n=1 Tax=Mycena indigotica TaxID=2126181 RepID=A0A8H6SYZ2_9AGAR|nr:Chromatin modification-related protein [Mycena indigotica]KAF7307357.1 Chromatin modification-related protein [Mycena indigotica]
MPPRVVPPPAAQAASPSPIYPLTLLQEYAQTLSALPIELSRNFADLRELDAVLSASQTTLIEKITALTTMIENGTGPHEQRMWMLGEIAEEATRLRLGGEDKIRVACTAADNLRGHHTYLRQLAESIPGFDATSLNRHTTYPHVATKPFMPATALEFGRRRRGVFSALSSAVDPSPAKRKRNTGPRDDDFDHRSPRKGERARGGARKKVERAASPTESLVSVTSHLPPNGRIPSRATNGAGKRSRPSANRVGSNQPAEYYADQQQPQVNGNGSRRGDFNVPPTAGHPSLASYQNGNGSSYAQMNGNGTPPVQDWNPPHPQTLEGPGIPRAISHQPLPPDNNAPPDGTDGDGDNDDGKVYCVCQRQSFGEMIACDGRNCRWEWFHLACIGMTTTPDGSWFCDDCKSKGVTNSKRSQRGAGGRRKASGRATRA